MGPGESEIEARVRENVQRIRESIAAAAARAGRDPARITLVGVTKYTEPQVAAMLAAAGVLDLGESRPQELWRKAATVAVPGVRWHLVGHLQRNKVRRTLPLVTLIHSADSLRLLEVISSEATALGRTADVLLEVNISGDAAKHGFKPDELAPLLVPIAALAGVRVRGLMTMAALEGGQERARRDFAALRGLRDRLRDHAPPTVGLDELSMGMSDDFEVAIEEGATIVRVGSLLLEGIE